MRHQTHPSMPSLRLFIPILLLLSTPVHSQCPIVLPATRIVGGHVPSDPQALAIVSPSGARCSASLISPTWALTAAHCHVTTNWTLTQPFTNTLIAQVITHQLYTSHGPSAYWHDISLLRLSRPLDAPVVLVDARQTPLQTGTFVRAIGYGRTSPRALRQIDLPVSDIASCNAAYSHTAVSINESTQLCAGYQCVDCTPCLTCKGDSGGPLVQFDINGDPVQVGIISLGFGCVDSSAPGVYLRVSNFIDWIRDQGATFVSTLGAVDVFAPPPPIVVTAAPNQPAANIASGTPGPEITNSDQDPLVESESGQPANVRPFDAEIEGKSTGGLNPTVILAPIGLVLVLLILGVAIWMLDGRIRSSVHASGRLVV